MLAYLLAALPAARLTARPEITPQAFLDACRGFVTPSRWRDLAYVLGLAPEAEGDRAASPWYGRDSGPPRDPAIRAWFDLEAHVDDAVAHARSRRAKHDRRRLRWDPVAFRVDVVQSVDAAFALPHPGLRERALDALRWRLADEFAAAAPDAFPALVARAVHLRLAWRRAGWDAEVGWSALEASMLAVEARGA